VVCSATNFDCWFPSLLNVVITLLLAKSKVAFIHGLFHKLCFLYLKWLHVTMPMGIAQDMNFKQLISLLPRHYGVSAYHREQRGIPFLHGGCWESNPGPSEARNQVREKDCRSYDLQPVNREEWILCSHGVWEWRITQKADPYFISLLKNNLVENSSF
jgi:hypothetical protein